MSEAPKNEADTQTTISDALEKTGVYDTVADLEEIGIDFVLQSHQLKIIEEVPILKTIISTIKAGYAIKDYFFAKKLYLFISGLKEYDDKLKEKVEFALLSNKDRSEMAAHLLFTLQRFDQITKADALCKLFIARINGIIAHDDYLRYSRIVDKIEMEDLEILKVFYTSEDLKIDNSDILRSFVVFKLLSVDYSGRPTSGQLFPRSGGGGERFLKNAFGETFLKALRLL
jgi:hypothetical protein